MQPVCRASHRPPGAPIPPWGPRWPVGRHPTAHRKRPLVNLQLSIGPLVALIAGILILIVPRMLNYIVALYLIIIGVMGLFGGHFNFR